MWSIGTHLPQCLWEVETTSSQREEWQHICLMEFIQPLKFLLIKSLTEERNQGSENSRRKSAQPDQCQLWAVRCLSRVCTAEGEMEAAGPKVSGRAWEGTVGGRGERVVMLALSAGGGGINSRSLPFSRGCAICRSPASPHNSGPAELRPKPPGSAKGMRGDLGGNLLRSMILISNPALSHSKHTI